MLGTCPDAGTADLFSALRDSTADLHQRLEDQLDLASPELTLDRYADAVSVLAAATLAVEAGLQRAFAADPQLGHRLDWATRRKTDLLVRDLRALGRRLPACVQPPALSGAAQVVGAMYVTEGSTLGGQVVNSLVRRRLGEDTPRSSFTPYGTATKERWNEFRRAASDLVSDDQIDDATHAAREIFELFLTVADSVLVSQ